MYSFFEAEEEGRSVVPYVEWYPLLRDWLLSGACLGAGYKIADRGGAPQASYDRRRQRNNFQTRPAQAFPEKVNISWGQRSVDAIKVNH